MDEKDALAARFQSHRAHLQRVAYRMLGSLDEAEDAVQEAWLKLSRAGANDVENLGGWLTTVVARVALDMLRARKSRQHFPDPIVQRDNDAETQLALADSIGLALLIVLETLAPAERLAFVLHDMFGVPFDEIAAIAGSTPESARQSASRARRRVQVSPTSGDADLKEQRRVVDAFVAAARSGNFDALVAVLDPEVVLRSEASSTHGADEVAKQALGFARFAGAGRPVLVNGAAGIVVAPEGQPFAVLSFVVRAGKIAEIDVLADPAHLAQLDLGETGP